MNNKEKFMTFVFLAAIARDVSQGTKDSQRIALQADRIPEKQIPVNSWNAAKVYLACMDGRTQPFRWMVCLAT